MSSYVTNVLVYSQYITVCICMYSYVNYSYVLVCTRMLPVCYSYVLFCYSYVTRMLLVCYSYVLVWCFSQEHEACAKLFTEFCHDYVMNG